MQKIKLHKIKTNEKEQKSCIFLIDVIIEKHFCTLLLDSGCTVTHISNIFLKENLKQKETASSTSSNCSKENGIDIYKINEIKIGEFSQNDIFVTSESDKKFEQLSKMISLPLEKEIVIDGILGNDVLDEFNAIIDYKNAELIIY